MTAPSRADRVRLLLALEQRGTWLTTAAIADALRVRPTDANAACHNLMAAGGPDRPHLERRYLTAEEIRASSSGLVYAYRLTEHGRRAAEMIGATHA